MFSAISRRAGVALSQSLPTQRQAVAPKAVRCLSSTPFLKAGHGPPIVTGSGGKTGEVPTDLEQATGLERFELLSKIEGQDPFDMKPLEVTHMGTLQNPIKVFSIDPYRIIGCTGHPVDSHDTIYLRVNKDKTSRCPECGCAYSIDYHGPEGETGHH